MKTTEPIIIRNLNKSFGEKVVLKDFCLEIRSNEILSLMGSSGCGKTTLLNILAGLIPADSGTITGIPDRISYLFQEDRLAENFSVIDNIRLVTGKKMPLETILQHLSELGIDDYAARPVHALSGGMKRRAALARAILYPSHLLLMDEALKGLDEDTAEHAIQYILRHRDERPLIFVTHDIHEAEKLGGKVIQLS